MIQDVILGVKNEEYKIKAFVLLDLKIFFEFDLFHIFNYEKKEKKGVREIRKIKNNSSTETEREGFEPSVRITRTTD